MPLPRLPRLSVRRLCACGFPVGFLTFVVGFITITFYFALPMRRARYLELDYQQKLLQNVKSVNGPLVPHIRPQIEGISQLFFWRVPDSDFELWDTHLGLNHDGTGMDHGKSRDAWIYLASTAPDSEEHSNVYSHPWKRHECTDPACICDMYLAAYQRIAQRWPDCRRYGLKCPGSSKTPLYWVDCDISPMLCSAFWGLAGHNVLVHMKVNPTCDYSMIPSGSCQITWRWIALPIYKAPWTRTVRIPLERGGSTVVPVFPSAEEQLWSIMAYEDAVYGLQYGNEQIDSLFSNSITRITPRHGEGPGSDSDPVPFNMWGAFRDTVDNPWEALEWPYEIEVKCYIERFADIILQWWDPAATSLVRPRSCTGVGKKTRRDRKEDKDFWDKWISDEDKKAKAKWDRMMDQVLSGKRYFDDDEDDQV